MRHLFTLIVFSLLFSASALADHARVAIIIDDIGYRASDKQALTLPGNVTFSVLPHTPFGKKLAQQAYKANHDGMLHIPMEAENGKKLGPGALTTDMTEQAIRQSLEKSVEEIPFAIGINNHMGSKLTKLYSPMAWTMRFLKEKNLLFVDSLTTTRSKASNVAHHFGVPTLERHIFLDNQLNDAYITKQFEQLISHAKKYKRTIAIAHPHPETVAALSRLIPTLADNGIELVSISTLSNHYNTNDSTAIATEE